MGYRTKKGAKFSDTTITRLLRDPSAKGIRKANYTSYSNKKIIYKPEEEWILLPCPPLISEETWNECQRLLDDSLNKRKRVGPKPKHLLAGYVKCTCNSKMYVFHQTNHNTYCCKKCNVRIGETDLEEIFHEQLKTFLLTDMTNSEYLSKIDDSIIEKEKLVNSLNEEKTNLRKRMDKYVEMRVNDEMDKKNFLDRYKPLEEQLNQIADQLPELQAEIDFLKIQHRSSDVVLHDAQDLYSHWQGLSFEEKRSIIEVITDHIIVGKDEINIKLSYLPNSNPPAPLINTQNQNPGKKQRSHRPVCLPQ
jgi:site-specific DNA recombinase